MSAHRYGCHNRPRPTAASSYIAQAGWVGVKGGSLGTQRHPIHVEIMSAFGTTDCQYDKSATDAACAGCNHATKENP